MDKLIIEASPYIDVKHTNEKAKMELYALPFEIVRIANKFGSEKPVKQLGFWESDEAYQDRLDKWDEQEKYRLFDGWSCKDMYHFQEIYSKTTNTIITFEHTEYEVNHQGRKYLLPLLPETIDDFITDLKRIGVTLFWKQEIADIYGINNITSNKKIIDYYEFVRSLGKANEQI
jgi:hypothetical protein